MYQVVDRHTNKVMGTYQTLRRASRRVDVLDNAYGAYRYYYRRVETQEVSKQQQEAT